MNRQWRASVESEWTAAKIAARLDRDRLVRKCGRWYSWQRWHWAVLQRKRSTCRIMYVIPAYRVYLCRYLAMRWLTRIYFCLVRGYLAHLARKDRSPLRFSLSLSLWIRNEMLFSNENFQGYASIFFLCFVNTEIALKHVESATSDLIKRDDLQPRARGSHRNAL